jgi:HD-GYP domain-containing protein (c-di-GMP phosphodiesterase class II)
MSAALGQLRTLRAEIAAYGSLPLLPTDDLMEYAGCCSQLLGLVDELMARPPAGDEADIGECLLEVGQTLRRAGDSLTGAELLAVTARYAERAGLPRLLSRASNAAGVAFSLLGDYPEAYASLDRAAAGLEDDEFGRVRSLVVTLNRGNLLHFDGRFDEAEETFLALQGAAASVPGETLRRHSRYDQETLLGAVSINLAANRCWWAQRDTAEGLPVGHHVEWAEAHVADALARALAPEFRVEAHINQAHALNLKGQPAAAAALLDELVEVCSGDRALIQHLPEIYRFGAEARALRGETERALRYCYRALESSLTVANYLEERRVVDTFVAVARLQASILFEPATDPTLKVRELTAHAGDLVDRLVDFLERKDWYTGHNHSRSVATLSRKLGRVLCEDPGETGARARAEVDDGMLALAGTLHDIGKLVLPWSLLNKIVPLTPRERALVSTHAIRGQEILDKVGLPEIGALVVEHHERPDGAGYPHGRRDTSMMGCILAVADTFEAMTTVNRRYRTPKTLEEAVREVARLAGTQFDPRVAHALGTVFAHKL